MTKGTPKNRPGFPLFARGVTMKAIALVILSTVTFGRTQTRTLAKILAPDEQDGLQTSSRGRMLRLLDHSSGIDCSPNRYKIRLDFAAGCEAWNNPVRKRGVCYRGIQCGSPTAGNFDVTEIIISELGLSMTEVLKEEHYMKDPFVTGDVLEYMSDPNIHPSAIKIEMLGDYDDNIGARPQRVSSISFDQNCNGWPIIQPNDKVGQVEFLELGRPRMRSCPAAEDCTPTYYTFRLHLGDDGMGNNINLPDGSPCISGLDHNSPLYNRLRGNFAGDYITMLNEVDQVTISEVDVDSDREVVQVFKKDDGSTYVTGDIIHYVSASNIVPKKLQVDFAISGIGALGTASSFSVVRFQPGCPEWPYFEPGDRIGHIEFLEVGIPKGEDCSAIPTATPTNATGISNTVAPTTPVPVTEEVTEAPTTNPPIVTTAPKEETCVKEKGVCNRNPCCEGLSCELTMVGLKRCRAPKPEEPGPAPKTCQKAGESCLDAKCCNGLKCKLKGFNNIGIRIRECEKKKAVKKCRNLNENCNFSPCCGRLICKQTSVNDQGVPVRKCKTREEANKSFPANLVTKQKKSGNTCKNLGESCINKKCCTGLKCQPKGKTKGGKLIRNCVTGAIPQGGNGGGSGGGSGGADGGGGGPGKKVSNGGSKGCKGLHGSCVDAPCCSTFKCKKLGVNNLGYEIKKCVAKKPTGGAEVTSSCGKLNASCKSKPCCPGFACSATGVTPGGNPIKNCVKKVSATSTSPATATKSRLPWFGRKL